MLNINGKNCNITRKIGVKLREIEKYLINRFLLTKLEPNMYVYIYVCMWNTELMLSIIEKRLIDCQI